MERYESWLRDPSTPLWLKTEARHLLGDSNLDILLDFVRLEPEVQEKAITRRYPGLIEALERMTQMVDWVYQEREGRERKDTGYEGEVELPLPPPWPGAPLPSSPPEGPLLLPSPPEGPLLLLSPPEGPLLLPSPPEGPLLLPSPPEGPLLLPSPPEGPLRCCCRHLGSPGILLHLGSPGVARGPASPGVARDPASPGVVEGPASPGVAGDPASPGVTTLWPEPHGGELTAMKKGGRSGDQLPQPYFRGR
ncbi:UNVERIFIED_CONTAM: hypothetical protein FKN15_062757 [Acipenser sinensis]